MNRVRITVTVPEMTDQEAVALKQQLEKLLADRKDVTIEMHLQPSWPRPAVAEK